MCRVVLASLVAASCLSACGGDAGLHLVTARASTARAEIVNGTLDTGDPAVVEIAYFQGGLALTHELASCTGELIGPHTVLTAGHCTADGEINPGGLTFCGTHARCSGLSIAVLFGSDAQTALADGDYILVDDYQHHPSYASSAQGDPQHDVGLMHLSAAATESGEAEPAPLDVNPQDLGALYGSGALAGVRLVGFGITPGDQGSGKKRQITRDDVSISGASELQYPASTSDQASTCGGDWGGPALLAMPTPGGGTHEFVIGVTSRGDASCAQGGVDTRTDAYVAWIQSYEAQHGDAASCAADGRCALGCTSPDPDCSFTSSGTTPSTPGTVPPLTVANECHACSVDADCGAGAYCLSGFCTAPCDGQAHCADGSSTCFSLADANNQNVGRGCFPSSESCDGFGLAGSAGSGSGEKEPSPVTRAPAGCGSAGGLELSLLGLAAAALPLLRRRRR